MIPLLRDVRTRLIANGSPNPGAEYATPAALSLPSNCTISRSSAQAKRGTYSWALTCTAYGAYYATAINTAANLGWLPVVAGEKITGGCWVRPPRVAHISISTLVFNAANSVLLNQASWTYSAPANVWTWCPARIQVAPANAAKAAILPYVDSGVAGEITYLDGLVCTTYMPLPGGVPPCQVSNGGDPNWVWVGAGGAGHAPSVGALR